jgi:hypothetical protein
LIAAALRLAGRAELYERLAGPLIVDTSTLARLNWIPQTDSRAGLAALMGAE